MPEVRKYVTITEEVLKEGHRAPPVPWRLAAALAVVENPFTDRYVQDLTPLIDAYSEMLANELGRRALAALGITGAEVEAFGKGALVGLDGEIEHGSAIIHTLRFGNPIRRLCDNAESLLPSAEKRGAAGATLDLALKHKRNTEIRSHHMTFEVRIPDAPRPNEIVVAFAVSTSGRPHARIGSLGQERA
jgi:hypothetical protein